MFLGLSDTNDLRYDFSMMVQQLCWLYLGYRNIVHALLHQCLLTVTDFDVKWSVKHWATNSPLLIYFKFLKAKKKKTPAQFTLSSQPICNLYLKSIKLNISNQCWKILILHRKWKWNSIYRWYNYCY